MSIIDRLQCATFLSKFCDSSSVWSDVRDLLTEKTDLTIDIDVDKLDENSEKFVDFWEMHWVSLSDNDL
jgi:hypothetical protein